MQQHTRVFSGALAALAVTVPHALGLGLIAFSALSDQISVSSLALWSAALPGALMTLFVPAMGVVYAPSTAVALLFGGMLSLVVQAGAEQGISASQAIAITGFFVALGFLLQWLVGRAGWAGLSRFLPISVTRGFSAGVGLSLVLSQVRASVEVGHAYGGGALFWHLSIAVSVAILSVLLQRLWPRFPALLTALLLVSIPVLWAFPDDLLIMAARPHDLILPPLPDWLNAPWFFVMQQAGIPLVSLSLLIGVVNGLEVLVFHQQLETEHGVRSTPDEVLRRESIWGGACALLGMIPASTSTSRSRSALIYTIVPNTQVGKLHALALLAVALTGHMWLHWVPVAGLAGALLVAGLRMVPSDMWVFSSSSSQRGALWQSWLVAAIFAASGGAMALVAGMIISTYVLLRTTAEHAIRRMHLHGKLRSRHLRRAQVDEWLTERMSQVAVCELQGIFSFSVAALVVDRVREHLKGHIFVILDAARVPSWDETALSRLTALALELREQGVGVAISGMRSAHRDTFDVLRSFDDLDRALEWVEDQFLSTCPQDLMVFDSLKSGFWDLNTGMTEEARRALERHITTHWFQKDSVIIRSGDVDRTLMLVQEGTVVLSTSELPCSGLRLAVIGQGAVFGEMAFLNGIPRTAYAHAGPDGARVSTIDWNLFLEWTNEHPAAALGFMTELARMGIRRLITTSQELRAAME